jgi:hypothetical protein
LSHGVTHWRSSGALRRRRREIRRTLGTRRRLGVKTLRCTLANLRFTLHCLGAFGARFTAFAATLAVFAWTTFTAAATASPAATFTAAFRTLAAFTGWARHAFRTRFLARHFHG